MRHLLAIQSRGGPLDDASIALARSLAAATLPYRWYPMREEVWRSPSGRLVVMAWDNDPAAGPLIRVSEDGAHAVVEGGHEHERRAGGASRLAADGWTDTLTASVTLTRLVPLYWTETARVRLVGSRALLLARLSSTDTLPRYDLQGVAALALDGWIRSERTPFADVRILPSAGRATLDEGGVRVVAPAVSELGHGTVDAGLVSLGDLEQRLMHTVDLLAEDDLECDITGGRDSRLVAAALATRGVPFPMHTHGGPANPDVVVGRLVAAALGQPHETRVRTAATDRASIEIDLAARTRHALFAADGMLSAHSHIAERAPAWTREPARFGGHGGESLRGGFAKYIDPGLAITWDQADRWLGRQTRNLGRLFRAGVLDDRESVARRAMAEDRAGGLSAAEAMARFYVTYRTGRWAAATHAARTTDGLRMPLFDDGITRLGLQASTTITAHDQLVHALTIRLAPALQDIPYAGRIVRSVDAAALDGKDERQFDWRWACTTAMYPAFAERILGRRAGALSPLVDESALRAWCARHEGSPEPTVLQVQLLWGLLSASVLLTNEWLEPDTGESRPVRIPVPEWADAVPDDG